MRRRGRLLVRAAAVAFAGLACGCSASRDMATRLANAAVPAHMPLVRACWEKQFEAAGFLGEYTATVDFVIDKQSSSIRRAKVIKLEPSDQHTAAQDLSQFRSCITSALNNTSLPTSDDENGPGFVAPSDLSVKGYVIAFVDASSKARQEAATRAEHVLLGPRADRCQGLYTYDPPREEVDLFTALGQAEAAVQAKGEPEQYARSLQKAYDLRLELRERLRLELSAPDLPAANRERLTSAIGETEARARSLGAAIGCNKLP